jgi:hypothetical protein
MTEQLKAEAYVREQRPALMELTFGCEVDHNQGKDTKITFISKAVGVISLMRTNKHGDWQPYSIEQCYQDDLKIIGHPLNLQDWLAVLAQRWELKCSDYVSELHVTCFNDSHGTYEIIFNLTTGQPATESDYQAFNEIVK